MSVVHTIRLREPWEPIALPDGSTAYRRRFGQPRLGSGECVWLVCPEAVAVQLNGEAIDAECDVTSKLLPRNELVVAASDPPTNIRLEIRTMGSHGIQPVSDP